MNVIDKLLDKGFTWGDIHFFLQDFGIGIYIRQPYIPPLIPFTTKEEVEEKVKKQEEYAIAYYEGQLTQHKQKWELANIAADFELPK